jgi:hypothetical protein
MIRRGLLALVFGSLALTGCGGVVRERVVVREPEAVVVEERDPVVVARYHRRVWEPSHWEHRGRERVWIEGHWRA